MNGTSDTAGLPVDRAAEMGILGCMIYDNDRIADAVELLKGDMFAYPAHKLIFDTVIALFLERKPVDLITLRDALSSAKKLDTVGGAEYLASLVEQVPSMSSAPAYAQIVYDKAVLRNIMGACQTVISSIYGVTENVEEARANAEKVLFTALAKMERKKASSMADIMHDVFRRIQDVHDRKSRILGFPTGFYELDDMISGLQGGQLYIIAGRPSMGKTSLGLNIAENVALREGKTVLIYSLEMSNSQLAQGLLCSHARVDSNLLRNGRLSEEEFQKLVLAAGAFHESKILIDDSAELSALELRTRARRMKAVEGVDLIIVDYLQKMNARNLGGTRGPENRQVEISAISSNLKALAKDLNVPVIALAQLNRGPESREDRRPLLSDLRESGSIEQDADVIGLLYRDDYYNDDSEKKGVAELIIAKNRTGPTGMTELAFLKHFTRFENLAARPGEGPRPAPERF